MDATKEFIKWAISFREIYENLRIEAKQSKSRDKKAKWMKEYVTQAVESGSNLVTCELAMILLKNVDWSLVVLHFEGEK